MFGWFTEYVHPLHKVWKRNKKVEMQNTSLIWTPDNFKKKMNATCSKDLFSKKEIQVKQMTKLTSYHTKLPSINYVVVTG